jgi:hypothetical protein
MTSIKNIIAHQANAKFSTGPRATLAANEPHRLTRLNTDCLQRTLRFGSKIVRPSSNSRRRSMLTFCLKVPRSNSAWTILSISPGAFVVVARLPAQGQRFAAKVTRVGPSQPLRDRGVRRLGSVRVPTQSALFNSEFRVITVGPPTARSEGSTLALLGIRPVYNFVFNSATDGLNQRFPPV